MQDPQNYLTFFFVLIQQVSDMWGLRSAAVFIKQLYNSSRYYSKVTPQQIFSKINKNWKCHME